MAVLMFWNTGRRASADVVVTLCHEYDVDVLVLAECELPTAELNSRFDRRGPARIKEIPASADHLSGSAVRVFSRLPSRFWAEILHRPRYTIRHLVLPIGLPVLLVGVHLPSKLYAQSRDHHHLVRQLREDIRSAETGVGHQNTVVMGDFNIDPFEDAMTAADGLHAMMDKEIVRRGSRYALGSSWDYFYNPMWSLLGDESSGPSGTYYYRGGASMVKRFWHSFDQILLRPNLLGHYRPGGVRVIESVNDRTILRHRSGDRGHSDHLPVMISLYVETEALHG